GPPACSPAAMQLLLRSNWPGNTEQLWQVLRRIVQHRRTGTIHPGDLPPDCWSVSRRLLSPLEAIQRDAIVQSLLDHQGNKARAAGSLGMSRATIYRKIHEYGIVTPASCPACAAGIGIPLRTAAGRGGAGSVGACARDLARPARLLAR